MNLTRNVLLLVVAIVCFLVGFLLSVDLVDGSNLDAWLFAGLASFAAAHLP